MILGANTLEVNDWAGQPHSTDPLYVGAGLLNDGAPFIRNRGPVGDADSEAPPGCRIGGAPWILHRCSHGVIGLCVNNCKSKPHNQKNDQGDINRA